MEAQRWEAIITAGRSMRYGISKYESAGPPACREDCCAPKRLAGSPNRILEERAAYRDQRISPPLRPTQRCSGVLRETRLIDSSLLGFAAAVFAVVQTQGISTQGLPLGTPAIRRVRSWVVDMSESFQDQS